MSLQSARFILKDWKEKTNQWLKFTKQKTQTNETLKFIKCSIELKKLIDEMLEDTYKMLDDKNSAKLKELTHSANTYQIKNLQDFLVFIGRKAN